jgi:hypothetical protein
LWKKFANIFLKTISKDIPAMKIKYAIYICLMFLIGCEAIVNRMAFFPTVTNSAAVENIPAQEALETMLPALDNSSKVKYSLFYL